jgi:glycosyltransferase involved in cell wall biosynthesis
VNVLAHLHRYPPGHGAGAEHYLHSTLRWLQGRGHECQVLTAAGDDGVYQGIPVEVGRINRDKYAAADVVLTHLDVTQLAVREARVASKPLIHVCHNHLQLRHWRVRPVDAALAVFNSNWIAARVKWPGKQIVLHPPVFADEYRVTRGGDRLTLVNLSDAKGSPLFWELARRMPDRRFLGVLGAYGQQVIPDPLPPNVEVWENRADARDFYRETAVLLMPSSYESFGRVAVEAAASAIPTIGCATPGLVEALGPALIPADRDDPDQWEWAIRELERPESYREAGRRALERSRQLDPEEELLAFEAALIAAAERGVTVRTNRRVRGRERPVRASTR